MAAAAARRLLSTTSVAHRPRIRRSIILDYDRSLPLAPTWHSYHDIDSTTQHFFVHMSYFIRNLGGERLTKLDLIDLYIKTLAKVVGSEKEAKKRIYNAHCGGGRKLGFGCEIDLETSLKLRGLRGVRRTCLDSYDKDYGGEYMFSNGRVFQTSLNEEGTEKRIKEISLPLSRSCPVSLSVKKWSNLPPKTSPWLLLPPPLAFGEKCAYRFYSIAHQKEFSINHEFLDYDARFVGSSHGWLALFNPRNNELFLWNPVTGCNIKLPPVDTLPEADLRDGGVRKVIVSCSPATDTKGCCALMIYGPKNQLSFCCPGHSSEWTPFGSHRKSYDDIIYSPSHKLFLCMTTDTDPFNLEGWDLGGVSPRMVKHIDFDFHVLKQEIWGTQHRKGQLKYLVLGGQHSNPPIYVVTRHILRHAAAGGYYVQSADHTYPYRTYDFDVVKLHDIDGDLWYTQESLDGLAMFIGTNHSFAVPAEDFPELEADCIYYTDDNTLIPPDWPYLPYGLPDIDIFSCRLKRFYFDFIQQADVPREKHSYIRDGRHVSRSRVPPLPMWFTPTLA